MCRDGMEGGGHPAELQCQLPKTWSHPMGVQQLAGGSIWGFHGTGLSGADSMPGVDQGAVG